MKDHFYYVRRSAESKSGGIKNSCSVNAIRTGEVTSQDGSIEFCLGEMEKLGPWQIHVMSSGCFKTFHRAVQERVKNVTSAMWSD